MNLAAYIRDPRQFYRRAVKAWARSYVRRFDLPGGRGEEFGPKPVDLALLHRAVIRTRPEYAVEFGVGFSTLVISDALKRVGGHLYTVDASDEWLGNTEAKLKANNVTLMQSPVHAMEIAGQACHRFERVPDVNPGFIYLDGPSWRDVQGDVAGITWHERPPISADVLLYESSMYAGSLLVVDGRTNNVAFLKANLRRPWRFKTAMHRTEATLR